MAKPAQWGVGALLIFSIGSDTPFYIGASRLDTLNENIHFGKIS